MPRLPTNPTLVVVDEPTPAVLPSWFAAHEAAEDERFKRLEESVAQATNRQTRVLSLAIALASVLGAFLHHFLGG